MRRARSSTPCAPPGRETAEGVENADAIAVQPGVDCLWVGHFDLSVSLGVPGGQGQIRRGQPAQHAVLPNRDGSW